MYTHRNEIEAIEYVRNHTSVPVPKVFEAYEQPDGRIHILMEFLPGDGPDYTNMTPDEIKAFGKELAGYLQQLRSLEPPEEGFIGSVSLGSSTDHRVGHIRFGPFHSVSDFHDYLRLGGFLESWEYDPMVKKIHSRPEPYKVKFTHADLNPTNVQYHNGKIQAIIDWEFAGWYSSIGSIPRCTLLRRRYISHFSMPLWASKALKSIRRSFRRRKISGES